MRRRAPSALVLTSLILAAAAALTLSACFSFNKPPVRKSLKGHAGSALRVVYSPDSTKLASAGRDKTVRIWDVKTGETLRTLKGHTDDVYIVAYSPDGSMLASGGDDDAVYIWDPNTGKLLRTLNGHSVAFSPDGSMLASGGDDNVVIWNPETGKALRTLNGTSQPASRSERLKGITAVFLLSPFRRTAARSPAAATTRRSASGGFPPAPAQARRRTEAVKPCKQN